MAHVGRIYHQAKWLFKKQRKAAFGKTRQDFKIHHGANHADYAHIYADSSLEQHIKAQLEPLVFGALRNAIFGF